ncbi:MAG: hypothetical protein ACJ741_15225 [Pyrinomonadaceae bacterium]
METNDLSVGGAVAPASAYVPAVSVVMRAVLAGQPAPADGAESPALTAN